MGAWARAGDHARARDERWGRQRPWVGDGHGGRRRAKGRGAALLVGLIAISGAIPLASPAPARAASFVAEADAWVDASVPQTNLGTGSTLRVDGDPVRTGYVRFSVAGAASPPSALLRLFMTTNHDGPIEVRSVANSSWDERNITFQNAPAVGPVIASRPRATAGQWLEFDVSSAVAADGAVTLAVTTTRTSSFQFSSREGTNPPELHVPNPNQFPGAGGLFVVTRTGTSTYRAESTNPPIVYTGSLKSVVEQAATRLDDDTSNGTIRFTAGTFDFGTEFFRFEDMDNLTFEGAGIDQTILQNNTSASADTEPFNMTSVTRFTIRDMTIAARGSVRSTSDAIDFDNGNDSVVERVKITASRGRGIIFDGKGVGWSAVRNTVRNCVINGVAGSGIELLAASSNTITGCTITNSGRYGIVAHKSSSIASTPNKPSDDNLIVNNLIDQSGHDGIQIMSSNRNTIRENTVTNSSNTTSGRDGIRLTASDNVRCNDNIVENNTATDNQSVKTQRFGLHITTSLCARTVVRGNNLAGNGLGEIRDLGSGTIYETEADTEPPSVPGGLTATATGPTEVRLDWAASTDNVGVTGYGIYRNGSLIQTVGASTRTFRDTGRSPSTTYTYAVDAVDAATNRSDRSAEVSVTTPDAPTTGEVQLAPVADTYVDAASPTTPRGTSTQLRVDGSPDLRAYLRFDVQGTAAPITSAKLRVFANSSHSVGMRVHGVGSTTWSEGMLYADAPALGSVVTSSGPVTSGTWLELDVTSLVAGNGLVSIGLSTTSSTALSLASRESSNDPQLVVTFGN